MVEVLSGEFEIGPGTAFFESPSGGAIGLIAPFILPVGLLLGMVRARWSRGRVASLVVELGRECRSAVSRRPRAGPRRPSLELAFAAPTGPGFVDAAGQPVELPVGDPSRTVTASSARTSCSASSSTTRRSRPRIRASWRRSATRPGCPRERAPGGRGPGPARGGPGIAGPDRRGRRRRAAPGGADLHDGAQERLVALALRLQVAKETTPGATALLDEATGELQTAIGEVRGLARGVHPTILTETGLRAARRRAWPSGPRCRSQSTSRRTLRPAARGDRLLRRRRGPHERRPLCRRGRGPRRGGRARRPAGHDRHRRRPRRRRPAAGSGLRGLSDRLAAIDGGLTSPVPTAAARRPGRAAAGDPSELDDRGSSAGRSSALARVRAVPDARSTPRRQGRVRFRVPPS